MQPETDRQHRAEARAAVRHLPRIRPATLERECRAILSTELSGRSMRAWAELALGTPHARQPFARA